MNPQRTDTHTVFAPEAAQVFSELLVRDGGPDDKLARMSPTRAAQRLKKELEDIDWSLEDDLFEQLI